MIAEPHGTSWPSSHPAVLTTFTRVAARELGIGALGRAALAGLDVSVAASRVALGVHYPSDVASGVLFGRAVARLWPRAGAPLTISTYTYASLASVAAWRVQTGVTFADVAPLP